MTGLLSRWFGRSAPPGEGEDRAQPAGFSPVWGGAWGGTSTGRPVNATLAENCATVAACVGAIASAVASLPPLLYRTTDAGRTELPGHPVARMLRQPWAAMTWPDWCEWAMSSVLLHGNALAEVVSDGAGRVTGLRPIPWPSVAPVVLPSGTLAFDVTIWPEPRRRRLLADEVLHLKDRSDDGYIGRSRISRSPDVIGNATALQQFSAWSWENQARPSGVLELTGTMTNDHFARLSQRISEIHAGPGNARRPMVLDGGATWKSISVSPEDAEVLASRRFTVEELCRLFGVPPPLVQDYAHNTFTNSQQASLWFAQFSLMPWVKKLEAEFSRSVIVGSDVSLEIDMSGLMRGDYSARWAAYQIARQNDILSVNEIRDAEGYGPMAAPT